MKNQGSDLLDSAPLTEPTHPLAAVVAALRRIAFVLLLAGVAEATIWYGNVRFSGAPGGTFTSIAIGVVAGTFFLAVAMAVFAYILDLLIYGNSDKAMHPGTAECRPLPTA